MLLIFSAPLLHLVSTLSAPSLPGQPIPPLLLFGCLMFFCEHYSKLRATERVWSKLKNPTDLCVYQSLISYFFANVYTAKKTYYQNKINNLSNSCMLFKKSLLLFTAFDRSSCQPYWYRASQEMHSMGLSLTSQIGPSRCLGEMRYLSHNI